MIFIGFTIDGILEIYSWSWIFSLVFILLFTSWIIRLFRKIPRFTLTDQDITYELKGSTQSFLKSEIEKLEQATAFAIPFVTYRGGLNIITSQTNYSFPYHIYSNERSLLQSLYNLPKVNKVTITIRYGLSNLAYLTYWYRNIYMVFLLPVFGLIYVMINKQSETIWPLVILTFIPLMTIAVVIMTSSYISIQNNTLTHISPFLLRQKQIQITDIDFANSRIINTGKGGIKNLTLHLKNKQILTLNAGLNKLIELDEMATEINALSNT